MPTTTNKCEGWRPCEACWRKGRRCWWRTTDLYGWGDGDTGEIRKMLTGDCWELSPAKACHGERPTVRTEGVRRRILLFWGWWGYCWWLSGEREGNNGGDWSFDVRERESEVEEDEQEKRVFSFLFTFFLFSVFFSHWERDCEKRVGPFEWVRWENRIPFVCLFSFFLFDPLSLFLLWERERDREKRENPLF